MFSIMSNLQTYYHFKLDFQKVDQHTGGKWLIHGPKHQKDAQLQSNLFYLIFKENVQGQKHSGMCVVAEPGKGVVDALY